MSDGIVCKWFSDWFKELDIISRCNQSTWSAWTTSSPLGLAPWGSGSCEESNVKLNIPGLLTQSRLWQLSTNFIRSWCNWATWSASATSSGSGESSLALWGSGACEKKQCERNILGQNPHCSYGFTTVVESKCNQTTWSCWTSSSAPGESSPPKLALSGSGFCEESNVTNKYSRFVDKIHVVATFYKFYQKLM